MKSWLLSFFAALFAILALSPALPAGADRVTMDLSNLSWGLYRDFQAEWINDDLYPPPVDIAKLPVNPPCCGWEELPRRFEKIVTLPATVEEFFWGDNGNSEGIAGDWRGVSWWATSVECGPGLRGKRIFLDFEAVHLRAEVYVNHILTGYDVVGNIPFSVDVTSAIKFGEKNEIAVRVTDPNGNFTYNDLDGMRWGKNIIPAAHGFGGIPGRVFLRAVDPVYIGDSFIRNTPAIKEINVVLAMMNNTGTPCPGTFTVQVYPWGHPESVILRKNFTRTVGSRESEFVFPVRADKAKVWDIEHPNLYTAEVTFVSGDRSIRDNVTRRFGFRWFDIGEKDGDKRFYLNGRRIVQINAYAWNFWPVNGSFPTREMAAKEAALAKKLGFNMMSVHTAIPCSQGLDIADEAGLLFYSEPGGYYHRNNQEKTALRSILAREKLLRMMQRDRSHPSLVIYNMGWNYYDRPEENDIRDMKTAHSLDPTRIITFRQGIPRNIPKVDARKLFMKPNDFTEYHTGFFEECISIDSQGYADEYYKNPRDFYLYSNNTDEIVYWGEDGNIGIPPRLQLIKEYYDAKGKPYGWQGENSINWFHAYDEFLDRSGFRGSFPTVDSLTVSLGNVTYYHHGRILENIRMGNVADNYTIIGWGASQRFNHNGMADLYRNPAGTPEVFSRYTRPLYVAVKLRTKVLSAGSNTIVDLFIVNEMNLRGPCALHVTCCHESGAVTFEKTFPVVIKGGEEYGQLLAENVEIPASGQPGRSTVAAELLSADGKIVAAGSDELFTAALSREKMSTRGAVIDSTGTINTMLRKSWGFTLPDFTPAEVDLDYIIIGKGSCPFEDIMNCVATGTTAIVIDAADAFAEKMGEGMFEAVDYRGRYPMKKSAFGGNFIAGEHPLLNGLPRGQAFNWEYQVFYMYSGQDLYSLRIFGGQTVIAAVSDHKKEVGTAVCIVPFGRGRIILSTLAMIPLCLSDAPQSIVAKRLMQNFIEYATKGK